MLCEAASIPRELPPTPPPSSSSPGPLFIPMSTRSSFSDPIRRQLEFSLSTYFADARIAIFTGSLPAYIDTPDGLFCAKDVRWAHREYQRERRQEMDEALVCDPEENAAAYLQYVTEEHHER